MTERGIAALFDRISRRYDRMNDLISFGRHRAWKAALIRAAGDRGFRRALDICCGTGDLALGFAALPGAKESAGVDFSPAMLDIARRRGRAAGDRLKTPPRFIQASALALPFEGERFDCVFISFGLRNIPCPEKALAEARRVLRPGGGLFVLESCRPEGLLSRLAFAVEFRLVVPALAGRDGPSYDWLGRSTRAFRSRRELGELVRAAGFTLAWEKGLALGLASALFAQKEENPGL